MRGLFAISVCVVLSPSVSIARDPQIGNEVFLKIGAEARVDGKVVDIKTIPTLPSPPRVRKIDGDWLDLGTAWVHKKDVMLPKEAVEYFTERIRLNPGDASAWRNRGSAWNEVNGLNASEVRGIYKDNAIKDFDEAIRLDPNFANAYTARGLARFWSGRKNANAESIQDYTEAIRLDSKNVAAYNLRGMNWGWTGEIEQAIQDYTKAIELDPSKPAYFHNRGMSLLRIGDIDGYLRDYSEVVKLCDAGSAEDRPGYPELNAIAWLKATWPDAHYRDGKQAVELATKACEATPWGTWNTMGTLAAASAEVGDFDNAVKWARKSLEKAPEYEKEGAARRLELYLSNKPYRDPDPYNTIAWTKACCRNERYRDGKKAVELATTACELTGWKNWSYLDTLAASYAETGDFQNAIQWQEKAIQLAPEMSKPELTKRLELYQANKPYRDER